MNEFDEAVDRRREREQQKALEAERERDRTRQVREEKRVRVPQLVQDFLETPGKPPPQPIGGSYRFTVGGWARARLKGRWYGREFVPDRSVLGWELREGGDPGAAWGGERWNGTDGLFLSDKGEFWATNQSSGELRVNWRRIHPSDIPIPPDTLKRELSNLIEHGHVWDPPRG